VLPFTARFKALRSLNSKITRRGHPAHLKVLVSMRISLSNDSFVMVLLWLLNEVLLSLLRTYFAVSKTIIR
jgi:hypothetical protein